MITNIVGEAFKISEAARFCSLKLWEDVLVSDRLRRGLAVARGVGGGDKSGEGDGKDVGEVRFAI